MDTIQIQNTLKDVKSFLGVFPSDLLTSHSILQAGSIIINTDPSTKRGSHWLAIRFEPRSSYSYYFDSYGNPASVPSIQEFIRRNSTVCQYNTVQLQGPTSTICGHYCCLFALYLDKGFTPEQFVGLFTADNADLQAARLFETEFGRRRCARHGGQCCTSIYER